ncbi:uracil-DNA glycosylase, partial [Roseomonas sp. M0104]|nr:uracil-DNA glycosylase [Pseudoroseomonas coralli]
MNAAAPEPDDTAALLAALRLQLDWGADEALAEAPLDRLAAPPPGPQPPPAAEPPRRPAQGR